MFTDTRLRPAVWFALSCALSPILTTRTLSAQTTDASAIEFAAATAMLSRLEIPKQRVAVSPLLATPRAAPPSVAGVERPRARTRALAGALKAATARLADVRDCARCKLSGIDVLLTLSDPEVRADSATVTVTASYTTTGRPSAPGYETVQFTLARTGGQWTVVRAEQLGVS